MQTIIGVIPARLDSTRFPRKLLLPLNSAPLIQRTYENAKRSVRFDQIFIATDSEEIAALARSFGAEVIMTSANCRNGTERIAEAVSKDTRLHQAEVIVNIQGDEPFVETEIFDALIDALISHPEASISTAITPFKSEAAWRSTSAVKCVKATNDLALYFSRAPIPGSKQNLYPTNSYKHIGLYAYRPEFLLQISKMQPTPLQQFEDLEQLQFLELGFKIATTTVASESIGIDTPEDLKQAEQYLCKKNTSL